MNSSIPEQFVNMGNTLAQAPTTVNAQQQPGQQPTMQVPPLHPGQQPQQPPQQQQQQLANQQQQQQQQPQPNQNPFRNFPPIPVTSQSMANAAGKAPAGVGMAKPQSAGAISSQAQQPTQQQQQIATQNNTSPLAVSPSLCIRSIWLDFQVLGTLDFEICQFFFAQKNHNLIVKKRYLYAHKGCLWLGILVGQKILLTKLQLFLYVHIIFVVVDNPLLWWH